MTRELASADEAYDESKPIEIAGRQTPSIGLPPANLGPDRLGGIHVGPRQARPH